MLISIFKYFFEFLLIYGILIVLILIFSDIYFKEFEIKKDKIKLYGILLNLSNSQIVSLSLITIKDIYIFYSLINTNNNYFLLIFTLIITLIYNLHNLRFLNILFDFLMNIIFYFIIISKDIFINYMFQVNVEWYALSLYIMTIIFGIICISYVYLKELLYILKKDKYIILRDNNIILDHKIFKISKMKKMMNNFKKELGDERAK